MDVKKLFSTILLIILFSISIPRASDYGDDRNFVFAVLKYQGGGDWYNGLTGVRNFLLYLQTHTYLKASLKEKVVTLLDDDLFLYPFLFMNGHGNVVFTREEARRLRLYLDNGGFLFCNDDYGIDPYFRRELKKIFPEDDLVEIPYDHNIYHSYYNIPGGPPKVHKHEGGPAKGFGLFRNGRLVVYYVFDADVADGWEEEWVHNDPQVIREKAMKMGVNIIYYAMTN